MSTALLDQPPVDERQEPVGIENPAMYTEPNNIGNGDVINSNITPRQPLGRGVDVHYDSGMTTIRIAGTPVTKRRQFFENKGQTTNTDNKLGNLKDNVPNSIKNSILKSNEQPAEQDANFAITTNIPIDPEINDEDIKPETVVTDLNGNDVTDNYNEQNSPKRKKVSFHDAVVINNDEVATLSGDKNTALKYTANVEDVEVTYTDGSITEVTQQNDLRVMNGNVTPIVDELELHQLSRRLSSKEKQGPCLPAPPELNSSTVTVKSINNKIDKDSPKSNKNNKTKKKSKLRQTSQRCLWMAVSLIILAIGGLLVLGILYAIRFASESKEEILQVLTNRLSLKPVPTGDLFTTGLVGVQSPSLVTYAIESGSIMPWQRPANTTLMTWHRGDTLRIVSLPVISGGQLTTQLLGDVAKQSDVSYTLMLSADRWYAAQVFNKDQYCVLTVTNTGGSVSWSKTTSSNLQSLHPSYSDVINQYAGG